MQINDKIKEANNLFTEYGKTIQETNRVLDQPSEKIDPRHLVSLYESKEKVWKKRARVLDEIQVLCNKLTEEHRLKIEKCKKAWGYQE